MGGEVGRAVLLATAPSATTAGSGAKMKMLHVTSRRHNIPLTPSWHFRQGLFF